MKIFFFTGSGNSLDSAGRLAEALNAQLISIASQMKKDAITINDDCIGIVFPVYFAANGRGIPLIVQRFIDRVKSFENAYIFAVVTSGHSPGATLENLDKLIKEKNGMLSSGFVINTREVELKDDLKSKFEKLFKIKHLDEKPKTKRNIENEVKAKLPEIIKAVKSKDKLPLETRTLPNKILLTFCMPIIKVAFTARYKKLSGVKKHLFNEYINFADNGFEANDNCVGCGMCQKICPVNNISLMDGKPTWHNKCENCLACFQWCDQNAIGGELVKYNERYRNANVNHEDMIKQKG